MVQHYTPTFDPTFAALSDATRRGVLERLARDDATISELAETFGMTLTGMKKHIVVLETAGLVTSAKVGRVRTCRLGPHGLAAEADWIAWYLGLWAARFDALDGVLADMQLEEKSDGHQETT